jgi:hypothetical protein
MEVDGQPDPTMARLSEAEQIKATQLAAQGRPFYVADGRVVEGESSSQAQPPATSQPSPSSAGGWGYSPPPASAGGKPPSGYRFGPDGATLEVIPGGPADKQPENKPLPASALKLKLETTEALSVAEGVDGLLQGFEADIAAGRLDLGPAKNLSYQARNAAGKSTPQSRAYASFTAGLEKLRNDSLRLNKGVQTDGDAQRAWNELMANINDPGLVKASLKEFRELNTRGVRLEREKLQMIDQNYGSAAPQQPAAGGAAAELSDEELDKALGL